MATMKLALPISSSSNVCDKGADIAICERRATVKTIEQAQAQNYMVWCRRLGVDPISNPKWDRIKPGSVCVAPLALCLRQASNKKLSREDCLATAELAMIIIRSGEDAQEQKVERAVHRMVFEHNDLWCAVWLRRVIDARRCDYLAAEAAARAEARKQGIMTGTDLANVILHKLMHRRA